MAGCPVPGSVALIAVIWGTRTPKPLVQPFGSVAAGLKCPATGHLPSVGLEGQAVAELGNQREVGQLVTAQTSSMNIRSMNELT